MTARRVFVMLTCHNRVERTLRCLGTLFTQEDAGVSIEVVLVDAGSTDGTRDAVRDRFPQVTVLRRGPELFWNGGMREAYAHAYQRDPEFYLWLNDDVVLDPHALATLVSTHDGLVERGRPPSIVVGSTRDPSTAALTYGGVVRPDPRRPLHYERVEPGDTPIRVETMNGNVVLVPRTVVARIGSLAAAYTHGFGDYDYGHRATRAGCEVWVAPRTVGTCARNPRPQPAATLTEHRHRTTGATSGLPPREWFTYARRWAGPMWPLYGTSPYVRRFVRWVRQDRVS